MKLVIFVVCSLVAPVCAADPEKSAVKISFITFADDPDGVSDAVCGWGSGTVVHCAAGKSLVLTNRHVCPHGKGHAFVIVDGRSHPAEWVAADDRVDLALVRIPVELPVVELAEREPPKGTELRQWGYSGRGPAKEKTGSVLGTVRFKTDRGPSFDALLTGIGVEPADSGAGLFGPDGKLVAVAYALGGPADGPKCEHCVRLAEIKRFLRRYR